jgi:hypothetical protein
LAKTKQINPLSFSPLELRRQKMLEKEKVASRFQSLQPKKR